MRWPIGCPSFDGVGKAIWIAWVLCSGEATMSKSVSLHRDYPAPPERVFAAFTNVELLSRWFGCGPDMLWTVHTWEPRAGGAIYVSLMFEKAAYEVRGEFLEVARPRWVDYRFARDHIVDVTIDPHESGSRVTVHHSGL